MVVNLNGSIFVKERKVAQFFAPRDLVRQPSGLYNAFVVIIFTVFNAGYQFQNMRFTAQA